MKKLFLVLFLIFFINGCYQKQSHIEFPIPTDLCIEEKERIQELQIKISELDQDLSKYKPNLLKSSIDLNVWTRDEIIAGLADYDSDYKTASWNEFVYNEDGSYYYKLGSIFPVDPFYKITYQKVGNELNVSHLRIFDLVYDLKPELTDQEKYQDYLRNIEKEMRLDSNLTCYKEQTCGNLSFVSCVKNTHTYYSLFRKRYLIIAIDDNGKMVRAFKKLYCSEKTYNQLTGESIKYLEKKSEKIISSFKKIILLLT